MTKKDAKREAMFDMLEILKNTAYFPDAGDFPKESDRLKLSQAFEALVAEIQSKYDKLKGE